MRNLSLILLSVGLLALTGTTQGLEISQVAGDRALWPRQVKILSPIAVPLEINGQQAGSVNLAAGSVLPVQRVTASHVILLASGSQVAVEVEQTDLLERSGELAANQTTKAAGTPPPVNPLLFAQPSGRSSQTQVPRSSPTPEKPRFQHRLGASINSDLVALDGRKLKPVENPDLGNKKYLLVYYSAHWCPPCRAFTPDLVRWYRSMRKYQDQFELIFMSSDKSEEEMKEYMIDAKMPWPAFAFGKTPGSPLRQFAGSGIPCLVILDENGGVVSHSYVNGQYRGPRAVMKEMEDLLKKGS